MTTSFPQLQALVTKALQQDPFVLSAADLGSPAVTALLSQPSCFAGAALRLQGAKPLPCPADQIKLQGALGAPFLGSATATMTVTLTAPNGVVGLALEVVDLPAGWSPAAGFPGLAGEWTEAFTYADVKVAVDTAQPAAPTAGFPASYQLPAPTPAVTTTLGPWLGLSATLAWKPGAPGALAGLLSAKAWPVQGVIQPAGHLAQVELRATPADLAQLPGTSLKLTAALDVVAAVVQWPSGSAAAGPIRAASLLPLTLEASATVGGQPTTLPISAYLPSTDVSVLMVEADTASVSKAALGEVAALLGVGSLSSQLPSQFPALDDIGLTHFGLTLEPRTPKVIGASATIGFLDPKASAWQLFGGLLSFDRPSVRFTATDLFTGLDVQATIEDTIGFYGGMVDVAVTLPDVVFGAQLASGAIDLAELVGKLVGNSLSIPKMTCAELTLLGDVKNDYYRIQALLDVDWGFSWNASDPSKTLSMTSVGFDLTRSGASSQQPQTSGQLVGTFNVGGADVFLAADYDSTQPGWRFSGGTEPDTSIDFTRLVQDAADLFGLLVPPLPSLALSDLSMTFDTGSKDFGFSCAAQLGVGGVALDVIFNLGRSAGTTVVNAIIEVMTENTTADSASALFTIELSHSAGDTSFTAQWSNTDHPLDLADVARHFGFPLPDVLPPDLDLALTGATIVYDSTSGAVVLSASTSHGTCTYVRAKSGGQQTSAVAITLSGTFSLADLPLVGGELPDGSKLGLDGLGLCLASRKLQPDDCALLNNCLKAANVPLRLPTTGLDGTAMLQASLEIEGSPPLPLMLVMGGGSQDRALLGADAPPAGDGTVWFPVQRTVGPFQFNRIGVGYSGGELKFALDAGMTLGPVAIELDGLSIRSPLSKFDPSFGLDGLGIAYSSPPMTIAGSLMKLPGASLAKDQKYQFDGDVVIEAEAFTLTGIGSYAQPNEGDPSLWVFAQLNKPLGGPPVFFVRGVMAGVGLNRSLAVPSADEVGSFPLLALNDPTNPALPSYSPTDVLAFMDGTQAMPGYTARAWVAPSPGAFWLAAGVEFTSFELVNSRALLVVQPLGDFTASLIGLSTLTLPLPDEGLPTFAHGQLQLSAVFKPQDGLFSATAVLGPDSYVLTQDCHLTGGFAFDLWFGPSPYAGDFVLTLGGYHPAFKPPSYYPAVPRLAFGWSVSDDVTVSGDAYFALTPTCAMGGGGLEVLFHDGDLQAWFTAHADVLLSWRPFFFTAEIDVSIGVSYRLNLLVCHKTISVSIGASVDLWGPPTGGTVHVDIVVISFSVDFGASRASTADDPLDWGEFKVVLPAPEHVCTLTAGNGLARTVAAQDSTSGKRWIVQPRGFSFVTQSAIPASQLTCEGAGAPPATTGPALSIRTMNKQGLASTHHVKITKGSKDSPPLDLTGWGIEPRQQSVPHAIWGDPPSPFTQTPDVGAANTPLPTPRPVGYAFTSPAPTLAPALGPIQFSLLVGEELPPGVSPLAVSPGPDASFAPGPSADTLKSVATPTAPGGLRDALVKAMADGGVYAGASAPLTQLAKAAGTLFDTSPMLHAPGVAVSAMLPPPDTPPSLAVGDIQLYDNKVPGLVAGNYWVTATHTVKEGDTQVNTDDLSAFQEFVINGPQFTLDPREVVSCHPPDASTGAYAEQLPHVVFREAALPWERGMRAGPSTPWLALLVFTEDELAASPGSPTCSQQGAIADFLKPVTGVWRPAPDVEDDVDRTQSCRYIRLSTALFTAIAPRLEELPFLSHCRQSDLSDKAAQELDPNGFFGITLANRFPAAPQAGEPPIKAIVHLVSLEACEAILTASPDFGGNDHLDLISLASWTFQCRADPSVDFQGLAAGLVASEAAGKDALLPRLPAVPGTDAGTQALNARLAAGFVPMPYQARSGEASFAWYRGPLAPVEVAPIQKPGPFLMGDAAIAYDATTDVFDMSLATAWQAGRAAALADLSFGSHLLAFRRNSQRIADELLEQLQAAGLTPAQIDQLDGDTTVRDAFLAALNQDLLPKLATPAEAPLPPRRRLGASPDPKAVVQTFLAEPAVQQAIAAACADDLDAIARWLGQLLLLVPLPFDLLVPDARLLPAESIRFFYLDANWTDALLDGALSIGLESSRHTFYYLAMNDLLRSGALAAARAYRGATAGVDPVGSPIISGVLLRSSMVTGWPTLAVRPYQGAPTGPDDLPATLRTLRMERLSDTVLLCLFWGVPDTLELAEPQEGFRFGVNDDGQAVLRSLVAGGKKLGEQAGPLLDVYDRTGAKPLFTRPGAPRTLNLAPQDAAGLVMSLHAALKDAAGTAPFGPAAFSLQMIRAAEAVRFPIPTTGASS